MLGDGDAGAQQGGVHRAIAVADVVDVVRIDAHQYGAAVAQIFGRVAGEEGVAFEILVGAPMA